MKRSNASEVVYDPSSNPETSSTRVKAALDDLGTAINNIQGISTGPSDPSSAPSAVGDRFVNTDTDNPFVAVGTDSVDDWKAHNPETICFFNGGTIDDIDVSVTSNGTVITCSVSKSGGAGNILVFFDDTQTFIDLSSPATVSLTAGTDSAPVENWVYFNDSKVLTASTSGFPSSGDTYVAVGRVLVQSASTVQSTEALKIHKYEDKIGNGLGHLIDINYWIRQQPATWRDGALCTPTITTNGGSPDNFDIAVASGNVLQLHTQSWPAFDTGTGSVVYVVNDNSSPYTTVTDLNALLTDSEGNSMSGRRFNLVVWGVVSQGSAECHLMVNLPSDDYGNNSDAIADTDKTANYSIPSLFTGVGFLICRLTVRHRTASSGTWEILQNEDLRGQLPTVVAGGGAAASTEFSDASFAIIDDADETKKIAFEASGITTGTTRTFTAPDEDGTLLTTTYNGGDVTFDTATFHIDSASNFVGIGTTSPNAKLEITHAAIGVEGEPIRLSRTVSPDVRYHSITATHSGVEASNNLTFKIHDASTTTSQTDVLTLRGDGNVGLGESSPDTLLHLTGSDSTTFADALDGTTLNEGGVLVTLENTSNTDGAFTGVEFQNKNGSGNTQSAYIAALSSSTSNSCSMSLGVRTGGNLSEVIRIDQSADVGLGTDAPDAKLHVAGSVKVDNQLGVGRSPSSSFGIAVKKDGTDAVLARFESDLGTNDRSMSITAPSTDSATDALRFGTANSWAFAVDGTDRFNIDQNGNITTSGNFTVGARMSLNSYTVATVPSAAVAGGLIYISDETGGAVPAFSDGSNWRRVTDRAIVS